MTYRVDLLVWARGTEPVETKLLVRVLLPAKSRHGLNRHGGDTVGNDGESVVLVLGVKYLDARHRDDTSGDVVLVLHVLDCFQTDRNF